MIRRIDLSDDIAEHRKAGWFTKEASALAFDPTGKLLAIALNDRVVVHELSSGARVEEYELVADLKQRTPPEVRLSIAPDSIRMSADGLLVVGVRVDREELALRRCVVEVFDRRSGALRHCVEAKDDASDLMAVDSGFGGPPTRWRGISAWALSANGSLAAADFDGTWALLDARSGNELQRWEAPTDREPDEVVRNDYQRPIRALAFDPTARFLGIARWVAVGRTGVFDLEVLDMHEGAASTGTMRLTRTLPVFPTALHIGPPIKMACAGKRLVIHQQDEEKTAFVEATPSLARVAPYRSLGLYDPVDMSEGGDFVLGLLQPSFHLRRRFDPGLGWGRVSLRPPRSPRGWKSVELVGASTKVEELFEMSSMPFSEGAISQDGTTVALGGDGFVLVGQLT